MSKPLLSQAKRGDCGRCGRRWLINGKCPDCDRSTVERPHTQSLRQWLVGAQIAGQGPKLSGPVDSDDHAYRFRDNGQAAAVATKAVVEWLLAEAGPDGAHGSSPALRAAANYIERQEKDARKRLLPSL